jgi:hypothetical protein
VIMARIERDVLPEGAIAILDIIQSDTVKWWKRAELATRLEQNRLSHGDLTHLEYLEALDFIEARRPRGEVRYEYRAKH